MYQTQLPPLPFENNLQELVRGSSPSVFILIQRTVLDFVLHQLLDVCIKLTFLPHYSPDFIFFHPLSSPCPLSFTLISSWAPPKKQKRTKPKQTKKGQPALRCHYMTLHDILFVWQDLRAGTICYSAYIKHPVKCRLILQQPTETLNNVIKLVRVTVSYHPARVLQGICLIFSKVIFTKFSTSFENLIFRHYIWTRSLCNFLNTILTTLKFKTLKWMPSSP